MKTYWRELGQGPTKCLALHCSLAHSGAWRGVGEALQTKATLFAPDFPGHGKNTDAPDAFNHVDQAIAIAAQGLHEPVDIVAHSFGAYIALRLAIQFPDKIKSLSLYEPVFMAAVRDSAPGLHAQNAREMGEITAAIAEGNRAKAARLFMDIWGDGSDWDAQAPEAKDYFKARITQPCVIQPWVSDDASGSLSLLKQVNMPVLLMDGEHSPAIMAKVQNSLAERIPNASRATVGGASHMGIVTHPQECAGYIAAHIGLD